jgi:hypothetical protein
MDHPFSFYVALDGPHLDGLIGCAGMLRFDWPSTRISIEYYDGVSSGHNISIAPSGKLGLLGNFSQQLVLVDLDSLKEVTRQSTMAIEPVKYRLRANTHHLWLDDSRFLGAVGDHLYQFDVSDLAHPERLGPHNLHNAHELRWDATHRYVLMGDLGPEDKAARQIAIFDLHTRSSTVIPLPDTCWHVCVHPEQPLGYAATYSIATENENYVDWSPAFRREYVFEIDLPNGRMRRTWSSGAEFPIHLNSDVGVYDDKLYISSGGSHTVVELPLEDLRTARVLDARPTHKERAGCLKQELFNLLSALARLPTLTSTHYILQTLLVTGKRIQDGVYACRVSPDGKYLVTGNRGYNVLAVWDRTTFQKVWSTTLPDFYSQIRGRPYAERLKPYAGLHLGMHHSTLVPR